MKSLCVFCSSSPHVDEAYFNVARQVGQLCAKSDITVIYGGGRRGLMGALADSVLEVGGEVIGVIPDFLEEKEIAHEGLSQLHKVQNMHERQEKMMALGDAFLILPGGLGTLAEFTEVLTWKQLSLNGMMKKPVAVLNVLGFWDSLLAQFQKAEDQNFLYDSGKSLFSILSDIEEVEEFLKF